MKIAIHQREHSYSDAWISYCEEKKIQYKLVDCYQSDIIDQISDCDILMWHFHHAIPEDILFARQLLFSVQASGKVIFPDFSTMWHFDDKIGQKYLLEAIGAPLVPSFVFYSKADAYRWINTISFPKVFKLRVGASSHNVRLIETRAQARQLVKKAFSYGFRQYHIWFTLQESIRKAKINEATWFDVLKSFARLFIRTDFEKFAGREKGYIYFQDFIPDNETDTRIVIIDGKAFGFKRLVRKNDFRASGSKQRILDRDQIDEDTLKISFSLAKSLRLQIVAIDYIYRNEEPLIVELSYGTMPSSYRLCEGYWDENLNFHKEPVDFGSWIIEKVIKDFITKQSLS